MSIEIEKNIKSRKETDRAMWFSMWFLLSVATFGIAGILMIYFLIKRRNAHFSRQEKLETLTLSKLRRLKEEKQRHYDGESDFTKNEKPIFIRNAQVWALSTILIVPAFYVFYFLNSDLQKHEEHEHALLIEALSLAKDIGLELNLNGFAVTKKFALNRYLVLTIVTLGFAALYWLYRVFNDYNIHFKQQWKLEDELLKFFKSINNTEAS
jgi:preprotein translocase subunit YajC